MREIVKEMWVKCGKKSPKNEDFKPLYCKTLVLFLTDNVNSKECVL